MNILETAQEFYKKTPLVHIQDGRRKLYTKELLFVIETAPFLTDTEKQQMTNLIPLYPSHVIRQVKRRLIEQGVVFLKLNPNYKDSMEDWLNRVSAKATI